jgi:hypothetical protein
MLQAQPTRRLWAVIEWLANGAQRVERKIRVIAWIFMRWIDRYLAILRKA